MTPLTLPRPLFGAFGALEKSQVISSLFCTSALLWTRTLRLTRAETVNGPGVACAARWVPMPVGSDAFHAGQAVTCGWMT